MNRHDGLVGVVCLVCLARVVLVGGVDRPRDVFATGAFADDDENVVHPTPAVIKMGFLHKGFLLVPSVDVPTGLSDVAIGVFARRAEYEASELIVEGHGSAGCRGSGGGGRLHSRQFLAIRLAKT